MKNLILILVFLTIQNTSFTQNKRTTTSTKTKSSSTTNTSSTKTSSNDESSNNKKSGSSFLSPSSDLSTMSTNIEFGGYPSDANYSFVNVYGHIGLNFDISRSFFVGPYFQYKILSTMDHQQFLENGTTYDLSSFNEWGFGASTGIYIPASKSILLTPELRIGYNEYNMQTDTSNSTNKAFLNHKFVNFTPRLNFGIKLTDYTILQLNGGYVFPLYLGGAVATGGYNPNTFSYGVGVRFYLTK